MCNEYMEGDIGNSSLQKLSQAEYLEEYLEDDSDITSDAEVEMQ